jgi:uncharacterized membrane protein YeiH
LFAEFLGVIAFALTGIIEARQKKMDIVGVYTVSMITAFGGGTLRDILIGHYPLYWVTHSGYAMLLLAFSILSASVSIDTFIKPFVYQLFQFFDAIGLGLFSAIGANLAYMNGCDFFISAIFGIMTSVFGGILRDIICNEIPNVFKRNELYATCSALGSALYLSLFLLGFSIITATISCVIFTTTLRMLAIKYKIRLPM